MKRFFGLLMAMVLVLTMCATLSAVAEEEKCLVELEVSYGGKKLEPTQVVYVKSGEKIHVKAISEYEIYKSGFYFVENKIETDINTQKEEEFDITIPYGKPGTTKKLYIESVTALDNGKPNTITKTGWQKFILKYVDDVAMDEIIELKAYRNGHLLASDDLEWVTMNMAANRKIDVFLETPSTSNLKVYYTWDGSKNLNVLCENTTTGTIEIPEFDGGTFHTLQIEAVINDTEKNLIGNSNIITVRFQVMRDGEETIMNVTKENEELPLNEVLKLSVGEEIAVHVDAPSPEGVQIAYYWDAGEINLFEIGQTDAIIKIPEEAVGTKHRLQVQAIVNNYTSQMFRRIGVNVYEVEIEK